MSTTQPHSESCKYCGEDYTHYHAPGYCSAECHARGMRIQARDRARRTGRELLVLVEPVRHELRVERAVEQEELVDVLEVRVGVLDTVDE